MRYKNIEEARREKKVRQPRCASREGFGSFFKFLILAVLLAFLNGRYILAVVKEVAVLTVYTLIKKEGSNYIAVNLLGIKFQTKVAVVYKLEELNDRWVSG